MTSMRYAASPSVRGLVSSGGRRGGAAEQLTPPLHHRTIASSLAALKPHGIRLGRNRDLRPDHLRPVSPAAAGRSGGVAIGRFSPSGVVAGALQADAGGPYWGSQVAGAMLPKVRRTRGGL